MSQNKKVRLDKDKNNSIKILTPTPEPIIVEKSIVSSHVEDTLCVEESVGLREEDNVPDAIDMMDIVRGLKSKKKRSDRNKDKVNPFGSPAPKNNNKTK